MKTSSQQLHELLASYAEKPIYRQIKPAQVPEDSTAAKVIEKAAKKVRELYLGGKRGQNYDPENPEAFFDACADTYIARIETIEVLPDVEASVAEAIWLRAGFNENLAPTTKLAQVKMQIAVIDAAKHAAPFFAKQAALFS